MNYLIFDTDIYYEDESGKARILKKNEIGALLSLPDKEYSVAVIETLQKKIVAPENIPAKKDEAIASSFSDEYAIESERIAQNLFQVTAIEKSKINALYKDLGFENVKLVVPYGIALREFIKDKDLFAKNKRVVFLDYIGNEVLLTIFNDKLFTTPRRLSVAINRVIVELTRSEENYKDLNKEEKGAKFLLATNSKTILDDVKKEGLEEEIVYFEEKHPCLKALKQNKFSMHYMLPEELTRLRRMKDFKKRMLNLGMMALALGLSLTLLTGSFVVNRSVSAKFKVLSLEKASLEDTLMNSYKAKYKNILRSKNKVNIAYLVSVFTDALPYEYRIESITLKEISGGYTFEAIASYGTTTQPVRKFVLPRLFKGARVENIFIKDKPAVRVVMDLF